MTQKTIYHSFPFSWNVLVKAREKRYEHPELFNEVESVKESLRQEKDGILEIHRKIRLKNQLPQMIRQYFNMEILEVEDLVIVDFLKRQMQAKAHLKTLGGKFVFEQHGLYYELANNRSQRKLEIKAIAELPLVGELVEKIFIFEFSRRSEKDYKLILQLAEEFIEKPLTDVNRGALHK